MKIKVVAKKFKSSGLKFERILCDLSEIGSGFGANLMDAGINLVVENLASQLKDRLKNEKCSTHKEQLKGTITVSSSKDGKLKTAKSNFCCLDYKNSIRIQS